MNKIRVALIKTYDDLYESILTPKNTLNFLSKNGYTHCIILDKNLDSCIKWYYEFKKSSITVIPGLEKSEYYYIPTNQLELLKIIRFYNKIDNTLEIKIKIRKTENRDAFLISRYIREKEKEVLNIYRFIGKRDPILDNQKLLNRNEYDDFYTDFPSFFNELPLKFSFEKYKQTFPVDKSIDILNLCKKGLNKIPNIEYEKYLKRLNYEIGIIEDKNFQDYFLMVSKIIEIANKNKILVGPGRGSAVGSLVSKCLNITSVDPIKHDLFFERFLNPSRNDFPDIDIDIEDEKRKDLLKNIQNEYGKEKIVNIQTKGRISIKKIENYILEYFKEKRKKINYKNYWGKQILQELFYTKSIHAAGVIISENNLREMIPVNERDDFYISEWDMISLEKQGFIKIDLLGLRNISILKKFGLKINDWVKIKNEDEVYKCFCNGFTSCIFQFESNEASVLSRKYKPKNIEELSTIMALNRPGPLSTGITEKSIHARRKKSLDIECKEKFMYFQEDIIKYGINNLNLNPSEADDLRKALSKKDLNLLNKVISKIVEGSVLSQNKINKEVDYLKKFAGYSFNKSHSIAYSFISYWLGYYKYANPKEFYSFFLVQSEKKKRTRISSEINLRGLKISINNLKNSIFLNPNNFNIKIDISNSMIMQSEAAFYEWINENGRTFTNKNLEFLIKIGWFDNIKKRTNLLNEINELSIGIDPELRSITKIFGIRKDKEQKIIDDDKFLNSIMEYDVLGFNITHFEITSEKDFQTNSLNELIGGCGTGICFYISKIYNDKTYISDGDITFEINFNVPDKGYLYIHNGKYSIKSFFEKNKIYRITEVYYGMIDKKYIQTTNKNIHIRCILNGYSIELKNSFIKNDFPDEIIIEEKK